MSWKYIATAVNAWKYIASAFNCWKYIGTVPSGELSDYIAQMAFWSSTFNFTTNVLTDKSGNGNHVPLLTGNCVNFINDVTITLISSKIGSTVTEVNFSATTTGVTVNGSGHIEIDQSELPDPKIYQIKLSTGEELFLTGGTNMYVFCSPVLSGILGGTEDTEWEWETQDDYFGNLQNGFTIGGLMVNMINPDMTVGLSPTSGFSILDADTILFTAGIYGGSSYVEDLSLGIPLGGRMEIKITVFESTEDFGATAFKIAFPTVESASSYVDDDGVSLALNGVHIITGERTSVGVNRLSFEMRPGDYTGKTLKYYIDYCRQIEDAVLIPKYLTTDAMGAVLTHPASLTEHNGCETQLDFSGISGVTDRAGDPLTPPSSYSYGDSLINPMFKRLKFNSSLKGLEGDYMIFDIFITGTILIDILDLLEESNMLVKTDTDGSVLLSQKYDSDNDVVTLFGKKGYNEAYTYIDHVIMSNTKELPIAHEWAEVEAEQTLNYFSDVIGPYNISVISWSGGTHIAPDTDIVQPEWEEIIAVDNDADTVTLADATEFPDPPVGKKRIMSVRIWDGVDYTRPVIGSYTKAGGVLSIIILLKKGAIDLAAVSPGDPNPPYAEYSFNTGRAVSEVITPDSSSWAATKNLMLTVVNQILDYSLVDKNDLTGGEMILETIKYYVNQRAPNVWIDYSSEFDLARQINTYYGLQENAFTTGANARMYFAHGENKELQTVVVGRNSGDRATYLSEKILNITDVTDNDASENKVIFMDLSYGTPAADESADPYWKNPSKVYFNTILAQAKIIGDIVTWRGGYNKFKNLAATQYVLAYYQIENGLLYFIVDFTDSLSFGSINEVWTALAGRACVVTYKDDSIAIAGSPGSSFTIPNTGLDLTATAAGNIKLKLV